MFKEYKLAQLYNISSGLSKSADQFGFGYPFVSFKDVFWNYFLPEKLEQLVNTDAKEQNTCSVLKGDVFLTRTSEKIEELGMSSVALKDYPFATFNGFTKRLRPKVEDKVLPEYIGFYLRSPYFRAEITAYSTLTTRASLNNEIIEKLKVYLPDLLTQKKIASILSTYDDLIENNNQRIKLLEEMAEEIYKEWFVRLRFPGYKETKFFDKNGNEVPYGTLGVLPRGWKFVKTKDIVDNIRSKYIEKEHEKLGIYDLSRIPRKSLHVPKFGHSNELETSRIIFEKDDILFGSIRSYFHKVSSANKRGITNVSVLILRPKEKKYRSYSLFTFFNKHFIDWTVNFSNGTKMPTISWNEVQNYRIKLPDTCLLDSFEQKVSPLVKKIHVLSEENIVLQETRDLLLPRLISGKLSVEDIKI